METALAGMGYAAPGEEKDAPSPEYLNSRLFTPASDDLIPIHLHRHIINNLFRTVDDALRMDMKRVWDETGLFNKYRNIYILKPELNIIYLCDHGLKHDFGLPEYLCEIERLIGHYGRTLDWKKLTELAGEFGLERSVYHGLYFAKKILSADVPDEVLTALRPVKLTLWERSFIRDVINNRQRPHSSFSVYFSDRKGFSRKAAFLFRAVFPPGFTLKGHAARIRRSVAC